MARQRVQARSPEAGAYQALRVAPRVLGLTSILLLASGCSDSDHKFGLEEQRYPQHFVADLPANAATRRHNQEYSWQTQFRIGSSYRQVEHGMLASMEDLERLHLPPGDYLFTSIEFADPDISSISTTHALGSKRLEVGGTFLFRKLRLWDSDDPRWIWREASGLGRMPFAGDSIERGLNADGYVRLYKLDLNPMLPNAYLFREPLREPYR